MIDLGLLSGQNIAGCVPPTLGVCVCVAVQKWFAGGVPDFYSEPGPPIAGFSAPRASRLVGTCTAKIVAFAPNLRSLACGRACARHAPAYAVAWTSKAS